MKKRIEALLVVLLAVAAVSFVWTGAAQAQSGCTSHTYLHVACATDIAFGWVEYDCCRVIERYGYYRWSATHVNITVRAIRNNTSQCRVVVVKGNDFSKYAYYRPDTSWYSCGL